MNFMNDVGYARHASVAVMLVLGITVTTLAGPLLDPSMDESALPPRVMLYVDLNADRAPHDGSSWCHAYLTLDEALLAATPRTTIRVADGVYRPDRTALVDPRASTFRLVDGVRIEGGYAGCGAPDPGARNIAAQETTLNGDNDTVTTQDNCYHVVTGEGIDGSAVLDGLTVTGGYAYPDVRDGAGLHLLNASPTLIECTVSGNYATGSGGGIYSNGGSPTLVNCRFEENEANQSGGGMFSTGGSPRLVGCTFVRNTASYDRGGGWFSNGGSPTLNVCTFDDNFARSGGGGGCAVGGSPRLSECNFTGNTCESGSGAGFQSYQSSPRVMACRFRENLSGQSGGGMAILQGGRAIVAGCTFESNLAEYEGGGLYNGSSSPTITWCAFAFNEADNGGGLANAGAHPTITNCTFTENNARYQSYGSGGGGAIDNWRSNPTLTDCMLSNNTSDSDGAGVHSDQSHPSFTRCTFSGNFAWGGDGGGMFVLDGGTTLTECVFDDQRASINGGAIASNNSSLTITGTTFHANRADWSGAIWLQGGDADLSDCVFTQNEGILDYGGAIGCQGMLRVTDCTFFGNHTWTYGGAVYVRFGIAEFENCAFSGNRTRYGWGGGMYVNTGSLTLINCAVSGNVAQYGGGGVHIERDGLEIRNTVIWGNSSEEGEAGLSAPPETMVRYSCVQGGWTGAGEGNIDTDPACVDPNGADDIVGTPDDDMRLLAGSPCIDAGDTALATLDTDCDGNPRFVEDPATANTGAGDCPVVDIGPYEFQDGVLDCCPTDVDENGTADYDDVLAIIAAWGSCEGCREDIDGDGEAGFGDVLRVLAEWGPCP